jgi:hypothetical protein
MFAQVQRAPANLTLTVAALFAVFTSSHSIATLSSFSLIDASASDCRYRSFGAADGLASARRRRQPSCDLLGAALNKMAVAGGWVAAVNCS